MTKRKVLLTLFIILSAIALTFVIFTFGILTGRDRSGLLQKHQTLTHDNQERRYRVISPNDEPNKPLVIAIHGLRDMGKWIEIYSGLSNLAEQDNFVVAYPEGLHKSWNADICCDWAFRNRPDDVGFIRKLINQIESDFHIDSSRVYVVGFSNGGVMTQRLLADLPNTFAAGAAVMSGVADKDNKLNISEATAPLMLINGSQDRYTPSQLDDTDNYTFVPPSTSEKVWANHFQIELSDERINPDYTERVFGDVNKPQLVTRLYDTSHRWPQWRPWLFKEDIPQSTTDIWDFLSVYRLNSAN